MPRPPAGLLTLWLVAVLAITLPAQAQQAQGARVTSGDHDGFTRLVVDLAGPADWRLGRLDDGYALQVSGPARDFDLSATFDRIGKTRLAGLEADPASGQLTIALACACHAVPFEFRPGVIVIDLRDGPPQGDASFEEPLSMDPPSAPLAAAPVPPVPPMATAHSGIFQPDTAKSVLATSGTAHQDRTATLPPGQPGYDWLALRAPVKLPDGPANAPSDHPEVPPPPATGLHLPDDADHRTAPPSQPAGGTRDLGELRDDLLLQLSRGALRGVVDLKLPAAPPGGAEPAMHDTADVGLLVLPGLSVKPAGDRLATMTDAGEACIADDRIAMTTWGADGSVAANMARMRSGLVVEFDSADPQVLVMAVRQSLYLGFGAEAIQMLAVFPQADPSGDAALYRALGRMVDGATDTGGPFGPMLACDGAAALWAMLSHAEVPAQEPVMTMAVLRTFSALPLHLRRALGPGLADRFLARGDTEAVRAIRDAIDRAPSSATTEATLIGIDLALSQDDPAQAAQSARAVIEASGPAVADAMVALVESSLAKDMPVDAATTEALLALEREYQGTERASDLRAARLFAQASQGAAQAAFAEPDLPQAVQNRLWAVLARHAPDSDLLALAIRPAGTVQPDIDVPTAERLSRRLLDLGFPDAAASWLPQDATHDPDTTRHLRAELALLAGEVDTAARIAAALPPDLAADLSLAVAARRQVRPMPLIDARAWSDLASQAAEPFAATAEQILTSGTDPGLPPLAAAAQLLDRAATARQQATTLLDTMPPPSAAGP